MPDERLARALDVFLASQEAGVEPQQVLAAHAELADLLAPMFAGGDASAAEPPKFGEYRVVREIGRGGAGVVYEAVQCSLGRRVALKVLPDTSSANATQIARLRREALVLAQLQHPHIVRVHDVGETGGQHWLAMDLVDGGTLADRLGHLRAAGGHRGGSLRAVVEIVAAVAEALEHVHAAGIVHRDVKPSNILLRADGTPLLSDFGLARGDAALTVTAANAIAGTPQYMSPEHVAGKAALVPASDVFSLGATLFESVTLCRAFDGDTTEAVLQQILLQPNPDPRRLQPALPRDLAAIVGKSLEKQVARRYASAGAFAADLRAFLDLRPVQARLPSPLRRGLRWLRREPLRMVAAVAVLLVVGLAFALWWEWPQLKAQAAARTEREYEAALARGWSLRWTSQRDECLGAFDRAIALQPHRGEALASRGLAVRAFDGIEAGLQRLAQDRAVAADGEVIDLARAVLLRTAGRHEEAAALAAAVPPVRSPVALWFAGTCEMMTPNADRAVLRSALGSISLAVRLSPVPRLPMVVQWAAAAVVADEEDALREAHRTLLQHWPEHPQALFHAARTLQRLDPSEAIRLCERARDHGMDALESRWLEYALWRQVGPVERALLAARECLPLALDDARRSVVLDFLIANGDRAAAEAGATAWLAREPQNGQARFFLAYAKSHADSDQALAVLAELVELAPDPAAALHALAGKQIEHGQRDEAIRSVRRALAMRPDFAAAHVTLVELLEVACDYDAVLGEWQRWAALHPDEAEAHWGIAAALCNVQPPRLPEALAAGMRADELAGGKDPRILEVLADVHAELGEAASAAACRASAAALRAR